jgi:hypothetical protein
MAVKGSIKIFFLLHEENCNTFNSELLSLGNNNVLLDPYPSFPTPSPLCPTPIALLILIGHQES